MAQPTTFRFGAVSFWISDAGSSPDQFVKICGLNELNLELTKESNDVTVPDCDDPDGSSWTGRDVLALSWNINGSGTIAKESLSLLEDVTWQSNTCRVRFVIEDAGENIFDPDRTYEGDGHVSFSISGSRGEKIQIEVTVEGDGELLVNGGTPTDALTPPDGYAFLMLGDQYLTLNGGYLMMPI